MEGGDNMARPIAPTPKLNKKATLKFFKKVRRDLAKPVGLVETPKLAEAVKLIKADADNRQK
jgi:hypothetical protein